MRSSFLIHRCKNQGFFEYEEGDGLPLIRIESYHSADDSELATTLGRLLSERAQRLAKGGEFQKPDFKKPVGQPALDKIRRKG